MGRRKNLYFLEKRNFEINDLKSLRHFAFSFKRSAFNMTRILKKRKNFNFSKNVLSLLKMYQLMDRLAAF
ncbi:hypothetical protein PUN28_000207 [Cardiocondyla obscurior]|uniref:Transposase n=1 Tax=Cardiocondyla obscurior TaxID=286306 RepID=A0AAW2GYC6_9HYME